MFAWDGAAGMGGGSGGEENSTFGLLVGEMEIISSMLLEGSLQPGGDPIPLSTISEFCRLDLVSLGLLE